MCFSAGSRRRSARQGSELINPDGVPRSRQFTSKNVPEEETQLLIHGRKGDEKQMATKTNAKRKTKSPSGFARKAAIVARRARSIQRRIDRKRKRKPKSKRKSAIQAGARTISKSGNRFSERSCAMNDTNET